MRTIKLRNNLILGLWMAIFVSPVVAILLGAPRWLVMTCVIGNMLCCVLNVAILLHYRWRVNFRRPGAGPTVDRNSP